MPDESATSSAPRRRALAALALALLLAAIHVPGLHGVVFENPALERLDRAGYDYLDDSLLKAGTAYGAARAANAFISLLQSAEVEAGLGVGVVVGVGEVLDPVNDLVERFSWVMLVSLTSLGIQRFLLEIAPWACVDVLLSAACVLGLLGLLLEHLRERQGRKAAGGPDLLRLGLRFGVAALVLRLLVPGGALLNEYVHERFIAERQTEAVQQVDRFRQKMQERENQGALEQLSGVRDALRQIKDMVAGFAEQVLRLLVLFVIQTVLLPLATLWLILALTRALGSRAVPLRR